MGKIVTQLSCTYNTYQNSGSRV